MSIVRASALTSVATGARLLSSLVIVKLVASFAGPEGVGKLGQLLGLVSLLTVFGGGGISTGIVKYVAEFRSRGAALNSFLASASFFTIVSTIVISLAALIFNEPITLFLLQDIHFRSLLFVLAAVQPFIAANNFLIAVLSGCGDVRRVSISYISSAVTSVSLTALFSFAFQLYGALLSLILGQAMAFFVTLALVLRSPLRELIPVRVTVDKAMAAKLMQYSLVSLSSAVLPHLVGIWIRDHLADHFSWREVGYWQAVSKVSEAYVLFFSVPIATYYLPKISSIADYRSFRSEIVAAFKHVVPVVFAFALVVYLLRNFILMILFSADFAPAESLFLPQLIGDVIRVTSFLLSYIMVARAMTVSLIITELLFSANYIFLVAVLTGRFGLVGAMYAFAMNYGCYLFCVAGLTWRHVRTASWCDLRAVANPGAPQ